MVALGRHQKHVQNVYWNKISLLTDWLTELQIRRSQPMCSCGQIRVKDLQLKVHSQGLLWQQIDLDIWNLHAFLSQVTKLHNSRARHSKNEILGETPLNMTWIEDFPCLIRNFSICYHLIFVVSPDGFNSNLEIFFWTAHSYVVQEHPGMNEFCSNARFPFWVRVVFQWEKWVINLSASSAF